MSQLNIIRFDELYAMLIGIVIDILQFFQNARACLTLIIVCQ